MFREGTPLRAASPVAPGPHPQGPFPAHQLRWPTASDAHGGAPPTDSPPGPHLAQPHAALRETPVPPPGLRPADPSPGESGPSLLLPGLCCLPRPSR